MNTSGRGPPFFGDQQPPFFGNRPIRRLFSATVLPFFGKLASPHPRSPRRRTPRASRHSRSTAAPHNGLSACPPQLRPREPSPFRGFSAKIVTPRQPWFAQCAAHDAVGNSIWHGSPVQGLLNHITSNTILILDAIYMPLDIATDSAFPASLRTPTPTAPRSAAYCLYTKDATRAEFVVPLPRKNQPGSNSIPFPLPQSFPVSFLRLVSIIFAERIPKCRRFHEWCQRIRSFHSGRIHQNLITRFTPLYTSAANYTGASDSLCGVTGFYWGVEEN